MRGVHVLLVLLVVTGWTRAGPDDIYLENGGYKGILIAINDNVPYNPDILPNLRKVFVEASKALYRATEYDNQISGKPDEDLTSGKHFAEIKVLVPKSWPPIQECNGSISELYGNADFRVRVESPQYGRLLFTHMVTSECREPGDYTVIPESFVRDLLMAQEYYGQDLGKAILHEWAQLRWGLREESNLKDGGETCKVLEDWNLYRYRQPVRCSKAVTGVRAEDPDDNTKCIFYSGPDGSSTTATASIMFFRLPFYSKMYTFCDSRYELPDGTENKPADEVLHDEDIDHPHNQVCNRQSAWQVLRDHPDFDPDNAAPIDLEFDFDANLNFQCVQKPQAIRMTLVLDTSGSMDGARIEQMGGDVSLFLQSLPFNETEMGMLEFAADASQLVAMIPLDSKANLDLLLDNIPTVANGGTCIGCGLLKALEMLEAGGKTAAGSHILVFTDGEENGNIDIADVKDEVLEKDAIVHGLLMDGVADDHDLIKLATESGGSFCIYEDSGTGGIDYYQCLTNIVKSLGTFAAVEVKTEDLSVQSGGSEPGSTLVDASFEDNLRYTLSWTSTTFKAAAGEDESKLDNQHEVLNKQTYGKEEVMAGCDNVEMFITAPDGTNITKGDPRYDEQPEFRLITVDASGFPEGEWKHVVNNPSGGTCDARLRIEGFPDTSSPDDDKQPILMTSRANKVSVDVQIDANPLDNIVTLYATLKQGLSPVVGAEVEAKVEAGVNSETVIFLDNGAGADNVADDGVYSTYFYQYKGDGVYSVRAFARGVSGQTEILRETRYLVEDSESDGYTVLRTQSRVPVAAFERAAIGGAFEVATNGVSDMNSIIPPARINDFRRGKMAEDRVELLWTAVGASMMDGNATAYDMRICTSSAQKFHSCDIVDQEMFLPGFNLSTPQPSRSPEQAFISLAYLQTPEEGESYYFFIKAIDEFGNMGADSSLAKVQGPVPEEPSTNVGMIVGIVVGVLAFVCLIAGGAYFMYSRKTKTNYTV